MKLFHSICQRTMRLVGMASLGLAFLALHIPTSSYAAPSAQISASRISGPAPLAVFFDATNTTDSNASTDSFRQLGYKFSFGDAGAGSWAYSGLSRNEQIGGPLAAHVFEQSGTYTVTLTVKDASGATSSASVLITVLSADTAFPNTRTVCLSRTSDFTGCPSAAQQISNATSWPAFQSGNRYLLHRGQDFTSFGTLNYSASGSGIVDGQLGAFGTGAKPLVADLYIDSGSTPVSSWHRRVVVMDLDARSITQDIGGFDLLLIRNTLNRGGMIELAAAQSYYQMRSTVSGWRNAENIFVVDNVIDRNFDATVSGNPNGITGVAMRFAVMGNSVTRTREHNLRIWQAHKAFIAHNNLSGVSGDTIRHALKIHSAGINSVVETLLPGVSADQRSSQIIIADNLLGSSAGNTNWLAATAPQNADSAEGIEYVIWEDNKFRYGANYFRDITWAGRQMTERGNWNLTDNRAASSGVHAEFDGWRGPYYVQQASIKLRFPSAQAVTPQSPVSFSVQ